MVRMICFGVDELDRDAMELRKRGVPGAPQIDGVACRLGRRTVIG